VVDDGSTSRVGVGATIEGYNSFIRLSRRDVDAVRMV